MLRNILIENFKAFQSAEITLANVNLFTGLNGMGKSSFIQVLLLLRQSYQNLGVHFESELLLKGDYINLGLGGDVFSKYSTADQIYFELEWDDDCKISCQIPYNATAKKRSILTTEFYAEGDLLSKSLFTTNLEYLNALRITPQVKYDYSSYEVEKLNSLGVNGQHTFHYLFEKQGDDILINALAHPNTQEDDFSLLGQVDLWMSSISPGVRFRPFADSATEISQAFVSFNTSSDKTDEFKLPNVGFGITYALPVVVAVLKSNPGDLIIIENPESHIHPRGQSQLGELFAIAAENGVQLIIETHSDHILNGIRVAAKKGKVSPENVGIFFFERDMESDEHVTHIVQPYMDENGRLDEWPKGFFDEWSKNLDELMS